MEPERTKLATSNWPRKCANSFRAVATQRKQLMAAEGQAVWINWFQTYEHARLARLTSFLRQREPDSEINYSILIYQLSAADLDRAIDGPPIELLESADFGG